MIKDGVPWSKIEYYLDYVWPHDPQFFLTEFERVLCKIHEYPCKMCKFKRCFVK
jgi:hypothetical protein